MILHLTSRWVLIVDFVVWMMLSFGVSYVCFRLNERHFDHDDWLTKERRFEGEATFYKRFLFVMTWKALLPDGSGILRRGFAKKHLAASNQSYLARFILESRRAEWTHVVILFCVPLFLIWNTWLDEVIIFAYGVVSNLPCILVQRFNRIRLRRIVKRQKHLETN